MKTLSRFWHCFKSTFVCFLCLALVLSSVAPVGAYFPDQGESRLPPPGDPSYAVKLGDADGDGDLDLYEANAGQDRLLLNDGGGNFAATALPASAETSRTLEAVYADVDGDGDADLFLASREQNRLLLNDGTGVYTDTTASHLPADNALSFGAAAGDLDGDGDADILVANAQAANQLLLNDGAGRFSPAAFPAEQDNSYDVALGDVNGDGDLDAIFANFAGQSRLYLNDGAGAFTQAPAGNFPAGDYTSYGLALGDVDKDGDLDAVFANAVQQNRLYLNDGAGVFTDATAANMPADGDFSTGIKLGDLDADGDLDIVISNGAQDRYLENDGTGVFGDQTASEMPAETARSFGLDLGDVDGDGDLDIAVADPGGPNRLLMNPITGPLPISIDIITPSFMISGTGTTAQLVVEAGLSDGTSTDVTQAASGTRYSVGDPHVATVSADGLLAGVYTGTTVVTATNSGLYDTAMVQVYGTPGLSDPEVIISSPVAGAEINDTTIITGTALDPDGHFDSYELAYQYEGESNWITFARGQEAVTSGALGRLDPTRLLNGLYQVRLTAADLDGNVMWTQIHLTVEGNQKIGNVSLSYVDVNVPVGGIPIQVVRSYDSRDKTQGDFGIGWQLAVRQMEVQESGVPGEYWEKYPGFAGQTCIRPVGDHTVAVKLPNGTLQKFSPVEPAACQLGSVLQFQINFAPQPGTTSSLESLDGADVWVAGGGEGPITLWDDIDMSNPWDPDRYRLTDPLGNVYIVQEEEGLQQMSDANNNVLTINEDGIFYAGGRTLLGQLAGQVSRQASGRQAEAMLGTLETMAVLFATKNVLFERDGEGRIIRVTDPLSQSLSYRYDAAGDLVQVTDREGYTTTFTYNANHDLVSIKDALGRQPARNEYDDEGRLIAVIDAQGHRIEFNRDPNAKLEVLTDRLGNRTVMEYDAAGNVIASTDPLGYTTRHSYDADGNRLSTTDPYSHTTWWGYDGRGNVISTTDALGNTSLFSYDSAGRLRTRTNALGHTITNTYDGRGNLASETDPLGNVTLYTYDAGGNRTSVTDPLSRTIHYAYDTNGFMSAVASPGGPRIGLSYDELGRRTGQSYTVTTASGVETVSTQVGYDANGTMRAFTDHLGQVTVYDYDAAGQRTSVTDPEGRTMYWEYNLVGKAVREARPDGLSGTGEYDAEGRLSGRTDQAGRTTGFEHDPLGRLTGVETHDGLVVSSTLDALGRLAENPSPDGAVYTFSYDEAGRVSALGSRSSPGAASVSDVTYTYDKLGRVSAERDALGRVVSYTYDAKGQVIETIYHDGSRVRQGYDAAGQIISSTDQAGRTTLFGYDAGGRLTWVTDTHGSHASYSYNEQGKLLTTTDTEGHTTRYAYDAGGQLVLHNLPLGQSERWTYDAMGRLVAYTGFNGLTTTVEYDQLDRPVRKVYPDGSSLVITYTQNQRVGAVGLAGGVISYLYDANDLLSQVTYPNGAWVTYTYRYDGQRLAMGTPEGVTRYGYDSLSRMATVTDSSGGVTSLAYDLVGNRTVMTYPNGSVVRYTYDDLNRLTGAINARSDGSLISAYTYTLGIGGHRQQVQEFDGTNTRTVRYVYDELYRLVAEQVYDDPVRGTFFVTYTHDAMGNRLNRVHSLDGTSTYEYDANDRLITETLPGGGQRLYGYDAAGNQTQVSHGGVITSYSYNARNQLVGISSSTGFTTTYSYAHDGVRLSRSDASGTVYYVVDVAADSALPRVLLEMDSSGGVLAHYSYGQDLAPLSVERGGSLYYYHSDGHSSTRALTNDSEAVTDRYTYDAWGDLLHSSGSTANDFLYNGQQYDPNSGYYFLRARYYDARSGRFITRDPVRGSLEDPLELNTYLYARADPVNYSDPSGYFSAGEISIVVLTISILTTIALTGLAYGKTAHYTPDDAFLEPSQATLIEASLSGTIGGATAARFPFLAILSPGISAQLMWYFAGDAGNLYFFYTYGLSTGTSNIKAMFGAPTSVDFNVNAGAVYNIHRGTATDPPEPAPTDSKGAITYLTDNYAGAGWSALGAVPGLPDSPQPTIFASACDKGPCTYGFMVPLTADPEAGMALGGGYSITSGPWFSIGIGGFQLTQEVPGISAAARFREWLLNFKPRQGLPNRTMRPIDAYFYTP
ncbi:MAG: VCBS repeat-containing protein [Thermoflexales bacterium]|nr:VCBS repeat-containing protein [Thermoflexales bacterium]